MLSRHISHLFIRDPIVIFSETIDQDDSASSDHWEVSIVTDFIFMYSSLIRDIESSIDELANRAV